MRTSRPQAGLLEKNGKYFSKIYIYMIIYEKTPFCWDYCGYQIHLIAFKNFAKIKNRVVVCESLFSDKPSHQFCRFGGGRECTLSNVLNGGGFKSLDDLSCLLTAPLPRLSPLQDLDRFGCSLAFSWDQPISMLWIYWSMQKLCICGGHPVRNMNIFLDSHQQRTEMPWFGCTRSRILRSDQKSF